jgi:hypothetical protein
MAYNCSRIISGFVGLHHNIFDHKYKHKNKWKFNATRSGPVMQRQVRRRGAGLRVPPCHSEPWNFYFVFKLCPSTTATVTVDAASDSDPGRHHGDDRGRQGKLETRSVARWCANLARLGTPSRWNWHDPSESCRDHRDFSHWHGVMTRMIAALERAQARRAADASRPVPRWAGSRRRPSLSEGCMPVTRIPVVS